MSAQLAMAYEPEAVAKRRGMSLAASAAGRDLQLAREIALDLGADGREVWADLVRVEMLRRFPDTTFGNWMGSCFRRGDWTFAGYVKSETAGSHGNRLISWRRKR